MVRLILGENRGFSILQVVIAATVLTGIVGTLTGNFYNQQKENKFYAMKAEEEEILRQLTNILKDQANCTHNFSGQDISDESVQTITDIKMLVEGAATYSTLFKEGESMKRRGQFQIESFRLSNKELDIIKAFGDENLIETADTVPEKLASLNVTFSRESKGMIGGAKFVGKIPLIVQTIAGDYHVQSCGSLITNYDSQWEMSPDNNDISFPKKVATGVEVDNSGATMQVEKSAYIEQDVKIGGELEANSLKVDANGEFIIPVVVPTTNDDGTIWIN